MLLRYGADFQLKNSAAVSALDLFRSIYHQDGVFEGTLIRKEKRREKKRREDKRKEGKANEAKQTKEREGIGKQGRVKRRNEKGKRREGIEGEGGTREKYADCAPYI